MHQHPIRRTCLVAALCLSCLSVGDAVLGWDIELAVRNHAGVACESSPVTSGVPLKIGMLASVDELRMVDATGKTVPAQFRALTRWPDGSIRWILCDFQASLAAGQKAVFHVENKVAGPVTAPEMSVHETARAVEIDTGTARFTISKVRFNLLDRVLLTGEGQPEKEYVEWEVTKGRLGGLRSHDFLSLALLLRTSIRPTSFALGGDQTHGGRFAGRWVELYQDSSGTDNWGPAPGWPTSFRGYKVYEWYTHGRHVRDWDFSMPLANGFAYEYLITGEEKYRQWAIEAVQPLFEGRRAYHAGDRIAQKSSGLRLRFGQVAMYLLQNGDEREE